MTGIRWTQQDIDAALRETNKRWAAIRDLLVRSLVKATGATKDAVMNGPLSTAIEHVKQVDKQLAAARVEGLREAARIIRSRRQSECYALLEESGVRDIQDAIDGEIAALERGKGNG